METNDAGLCKMISNVKETSGTGFLTEYQLVPNYDGSLVGSYILECRAGFRRVGKINAMFFVTFPLEKSSTIGRSLLLEHYKSTDLLELHINRSRGWFRVGHTLILFIRLGPHNVVGEKSFGGLLPILSVDLTIAPAEDSIKTYGMWKSREVEVEELEDGRLRISINCTGLDLGEEQYRARLIIIDQPHYIDLDVYVSSKGQDETSESGDKSAYLAGIHSQKTLVRALMCEALSEECSNALRRGEPVEETIAKFTNHPSFYFSFKFGQNAISRYRSRGIVINLIATSKLSNEPIVKPKHVSIHHAFLPYESIAEWVLPSVSMESKMILPVEISVNNFSNCGPYYVRFHSTPGEQIVWDEDTLILVFLTEYPAIRLSRKTAMPFEWVRLTGFTELEDAHFQGSNITLLRVTWIVQSKGYWRRVITYNYTSPTNETVDYGAGFSPNDVVVVSIGWGVHLDIKARPDINEAIFGCLLMFGSTEMQTNKLLEYPNYLYIETDTPFHVLSEFTSPAMEFNRSGYYHSSPNLERYVQVVLVRPSTSTIRISCLLDHLAARGYARKLFFIRVHLRVKFNGTTKEQELSISRFYGRLRFQYLWRADGIVRIADYSWHGMRLSCHNVYTPSIYRDDIKLSFGSSQIEFYMPYHRIIIRKADHEITTNRIEFYLRKASNFICYTETNLGLFVHQWHVRRVYDHSDQSEWRDQTTLRTGTYASSKPGEPSVLHIPYTFTLTVERYTATCKVHAVNGQTPLPNTAVIRFSLPSLGQQTTALMRMDSLSVEYLLIALLTGPVLLIAMRIPFWVKRFDEDRRERARHESSVVSSIDSRMSRLLRGKRIRRRTTVHEDVKDVVTQTTTRTPSGRTRTSKMKRLTVRGTKRKRSVMRASIRRRNYGRRVSRVSTRIRRESSKLGHKLSPYLSIS
ncbi:unnamed protein product [Calicophoron daubneyi]|uniref:Uncharacterized protein n=1 Tax=Calicophoron daubneyi TaxID=300641 RepID=A0AAV2U061_CALDB